MEQRLIINPPSMVEKLWLARHHYDEDRRLIIPKVGGSRWGAVQEYTADGNLVYRDWWVRNLKVEDVEAAPSTDIEVVREEDSEARPPVLGISGIEMDDALMDDSAVQTESVPVDTGPAFPVSPVGEVDPFSPVSPTGPDSSASPAEIDPFAPLPPAMESTPDAPAEPDPFGPLPNPF